jgi:hypothetical protein
MSPVNIKALAVAVVDELVARKMIPPARYDDPGLPSTMTVAQFAIAIGRDPEVVRRKIRSRIIPPSSVEAGPPYRIGIGALKFFNVSLEVAADRLRAAQVQHANSGPSPAPSSA